jgi:UDP-N-acetylglucosamine acyltransferase
MNIHPTAVIDPSAEIGEGVEIGPYAVIGQDVRIGPFCRIGPFVELKHTHLGARCQIGSKTALGGDPQIAGFQDRPSRVTVGDDCYIHEMVTIHRSSQENGVTSVGNGCYLMSLCHLGHDCRIGEGVIVTTFAGLSGHIEVGDHAVLGGGAGFHQFVRVGRLAMVGAKTRLNKDIPPFMTVADVPSRIIGINSVGLDRNGVSAETKRDLKKAYLLLYKSNLNVQQAVDRIRQEIPPREEISQLLQFIEDSKRGISK